MRQKSKWSSSQRTWVCAITILLFIMGVILYASFRIVIVHGNSMFPTLHDGQILIVPKNSGKIEKGSIVVFKKDETVYIKRVIAIENDIVAMDAYAGYLAVNGIEILYEKPDCIKDPVINVIPEGCFFVLGDNYMESTDSRNSEVGLVSKAEIIGVARR